MSVLTELGRIYLLYAAFGGIWSMNVKVGEMVGLGLVGWGAAALVDG